MLFGLVYFIDDYYGKIEIFGIPFVLSRVPNNICLLVSYTIRICSANTGLCDHKLGMFLRNQAPSGSSRFMRGGGIKLTRWSTLMMSEVSGPTEYAHQT